MFCHMHVIQMLILKLTILKDGYLGGLGDMDNAGRIGLYFFINVTRISFLINYYLPYMLILVCHCFRSYCPGMGLQTTVSMLHIYPRHMQEETHVHLI